MNNIVCYTLNKQNIKLGSMVYLDSNQSDKIEREINILLSPDNNYICHCAVVMSSVLLNCDKSSSINFYITDSGISTKNKEYLKSLNNIRPFNIFFIDISKYDLSMFPLNRKHIKVPTTYHRLLAPDILPESIDKIVYLDCDVIVEKDLKELFDIDLGDNLIAAVEDEAALQNCIRLDLDFYFNSGVILFNIKKLRKFDLFNKCLSYFYKNKGIITLQDQDILNGVLSNKCLHLPLMWNASTPIFKEEIWKQKTSIHEKIIAGLEPGIIHFTYAPKPWNKKCTHILRDEYYKYLRVADFEKYKKYVNNKKFDNLFNVVKSNKHIIFILFGMKIKIPRKSKMRIMQDNLSDMQYRLVEINSKLDKLSSAFNCSEK